jgi:hypothetical protein
MTSRLAGARDMDQAISNALKEKEQLKKRLAEIEHFLRLYERFSKGNQAPTADAPAVDKSRKSTQVPRKRESVHDVHVTGTLHGPAVVVRVTKAILKDLGVPRTRGYLADELQHRKVYLPGKDTEARARYVGTILWRNRDDFEHIEGQGYWLKGVPVPDTPEQKRELRLEDRLI